MVMMDVVMLMVRKRILRCKFWAVEVSWMLGGTDVPPLRSTLHVCICCAFKYGGKALEQGREGIVGLTSIHRRR